MSDSYGAKYNKNHTKFENYLDVIKLSLKISDDSMLEILAQKVVDLGPTTHYSKHVSHLDEATEVLEEQDEQMSKRRRCRSGIGRNLSSTLVKNLQLK